MALADSAAKLRVWLVGTALPVWAERARFPDGSWVEHLTLDGTPDRQAERRWRVMARQTVAYAQAAQAGWYDGAEIARRSFESYWTKGWTGTHIVHRIMPDGTVSDDRPDLYDHAFGLLACAHMLSLSGDEAYRSHADDILGWIATQSHPAGGWREGDVVPHPRRQNPHMHLLEASLALHQADGNPDDLSIAHEVVRLFGRHFLREGMIGEYFEDDWSPHDRRGDVVEPGHSAEWVWLLTRYDHVAGTDHGSACRALYDHAFRHRLATLFDEERRDGEIVRETTRLWVHMEAVKAHLSMAERGWPGSSAMAAASLDALLGPVLRPDGTWVDRHNACGAVVSDMIPTSTLYHIVGTAVEAQRVVDSLR
ncbi:AGE family epimerase/isomerase [uncultured Algimonas sp.]|uniref:AGE family epimerase/isomerase n=1 Tax=uncultured Algimonas sp. TaxID=1547920 RepID=UPI00261D6FA0|nr:AGE family epimerase/isomerase [uncultured Algimonas sp.]